MIKDIISKISKYKENDYKNFLNNTDLEILHKIKLFVDDIYYNTGKDSGLSDYNYDLLKEFLEKKDPDYIVPIGIKIRNGENRIKLPFYMGSMDKYKPENKKQIKNWLKKNNSEDYIIESKLDGVSCLLVMKNGKIKLYTRGDGNVGSDISYLSQYFNTIPKNTNYDLVVRGELIIKKETFVKKYSKKFANARNMVSGKIGSKTIKEGIKDIDFVAYEIVGDGIMESPKTQFNLLKNLGFSIVKNKIIKNINTEILSKELIDFKKSEQYQIDGIIIQTNKKYKRNKSGNPKYAFAFKMRFSDNIVKTEVISVEWNVSKWGQLKPRIKIKEVSLGGVKINYTSGFNAKYINDNKIGKGSVINITRSGDVIPYIVEVLKSSENPDMPEIEYQWNETKVDIYTTKYGEKMCVKLISSFFSELGIKHVSESTVAKLYKNGYDSLLKIIMATKQDFLKIDTFGERLVERTYNNIHNGLQNIPIYIVLGASGIFGYGLGTRKIKKLLKDIPDLLQIYKNKDKSEMFDMIMKVDGFSKKSTSKIVDNLFWADKFIIALSNFATFKKEKEVSNNKLKDKKIVFSGFRDKNLEENINIMGGKVNSSVSKNTDFVIVIDRNNTSSKIQKAQKLNIQIIEKDEFIKIYI